MTIAPPMNWLRQFHEELTEQKKIPLWGNPPCFPWEDFSEKIKTLLEIPDFRIYPTLCESLPSEKPLDLFGTNPKTVSFQLSPLQGKLTWIMSSESIDKMTSLLLKGEDTKGLSDPKFQDGFYKFLLLQISRQVAELKIYKDLQIELSFDVETPIESPFYIDLSIQIHEKAFLGRLIISSEFQKAFALHFKKDTVDPLTSPICSQIDMPLQLEAGSCLISQKEWSTIQTGDFLVLDHCTYDPETHKGVLDLSWNNKPLFKVKTKKTSLKILDYAVYNGDLNTMDEHLPEELPPQELPIQEHSFSDNEDDLLGNADHLWETPEDTEEAPPILSEKPSEPIFSTKDIPFLITVEVDRIKMSLEKLLQLQPGNVLELITKPEQGVTLTVNGKKIATGELIKLGDLLGVKILEVGEKTK